MSNSQVATHDLLINRLHRAEGQIRGIARMVEEDRACVDVLTLIAAVDAALDEVAVALVEERVRRCLEGEPADVTAAEVMAAMRLLARG